jgi:tungstate transport system substrate-binding protein
VKNARAAALPLCSNRAMHPDRRTFLIAAAAALPLAAPAQQRAALVDPLRLGADRGLAAAGLVPALLRAFGRDTGIAIKLATAPSAQVLEQLDRGEIDVTLTDAPALEDQLVAAGLAHDARVVADVQFVLLGPAPAKGKTTGDTVLPGGVRDIAEALRTIHAAGAPFLSAGDGSGAHLIEQALWRAAQVAPAAPWYRPAAQGAALAAEARAAGAFAIVERGLGAAGAPQAVRVDGDARLVAPARVLRAFRSRHPAAKIFSDWIAGTKGRAVVRSLRGFA